MNNDLQQLFDPMVDMLAAVIEHTANDNQYRTEYWRIMSSGNWMNQNFRSLAEDCFGMLCQDFNNYQRNETLENVLQDVCERWVTMDLAAWMLSDDRMANSLDDNMYARAQQLQRDRQSVLAQNDRMRGSGMGGMRNTRLSANTRLGVPNNSMGNQFNRGQRNSVPGGLFAQASDNYNSQQNQGRRSGIGAVRDLSQSQQPQPRQETSRQAQPAPAAQPAPEVRQPEPRSREQRLEGPDYTQAKPYDSFFLNGEEWRPAHLSKWHLSWTPSQPFPTMFNPLTHMRYFVMGTDKNIREEFLPMSQDQAYLAHSLVPPVQRGQEVQRPRYERVQSDGAPAPVTPTVNEHHLVKRAAGSLNWVTENVVTVGSIEEAELITELDRMKGDKGNAVMSFARTVPVVTDLTKYKALGEVRNANNLTHAAEILRSAVGSAEVSLWNRINDRFTQAVNHVVEHQFNKFGINGTLRIRDFAHDYQDLLNWIKEKRSEATARNFSQLTRHLIDKVTSKLEEANVITYIVNTIDITEEEFKQARPPVVVFEDFFTVGAVPFTTHELGLLLTEESQAISPDVAPQLHRLVETLSIASEDRNPAATVYLITKDLVRIEILKSGNDMTSYLLRKLG